MQACKRKYIHLYDGSTHAIVLLLTSCFVFGLAAAADMLQGVDVPRFSYAGSRVNVSCSYDLTSTGLYSLKWYHNDQEFYRHVPTERNRPVVIKPSLKFNVHEVSRSDQQVTLELTSLTSEASGEYKCEVIAEHPSFRTETRAANMTVMAERPQPPAITGGQESYEAGELVQLLCTPQYLSPAALHTQPQPTITWYIAGHPAPPEHVIPHRGRAREPPGLTLSVRADKVSRLTGGGEVEFQCLLTLADSKIRSSSSMKTTLQRSSYLYNYFSAEYDEGLSERRHDRNKIKLDLSND
ncbi:uncharacterized protein LOC125178137 [Hyalella azteca]|uniref:Uncharacterized protein LOC125178137 n=1 Tax=Hyalella azteca TaxID=294128 RepID=A0A979FLT4_HYAAZ|nr:uncharacterized protein LOC125178137 [Hyalella azteca]